MGSSPAVSVVVPFYNVEAYATDCLSRLCEQTLEDIEIICVDAGSTDGTLEIIGRFAQQDPRIRLLLSDKKSYGYQMNLGMSEAKGEYIGIVETDTEENILKLSQRMQDALPKIYATNNLDMLFCMVAISGETTRLIWYGEDAEAAVRESFPEYDGSGFLVFIPSVSRKAIIVPALTATLEKWSPAKK